MYKLWKCFNTTLKFLNKSWISQLLLELEVGLSSGSKPNKSVESPSRGDTTANSHQNFFTGRNQSFCWTISNHFNLYDCRFFGCKAASWYSGSSMGPRLEDRTGILIIFYFTPQVWWSNNIPIVNLKMSLIEFHKVKRFPEILNRRPTFWIKVRMWPSIYY